MLLYHFPLTSSSATATIVNKGLKNDYTISGDNNFSSGGKLSAYAKDMGENKFYLSIPNFSLDYTLCFRAKATSKILLVSVGYTPFEITADNAWHDYVICDKKVYKDGLFLTNYNYSAGIVAFGDGEDSCQGLIQDIRIYDYALSQAEINEYSRAMVVHYPLQGNELNTSVLKDVSGFGNDLDGLPTSFSYANTLLPRGTVKLNLSTKAFEASYNTELKGNPKVRTISFWWRASQLVTGVPSLRGLRLFILQSGEVQSWLVYNGLVVSSNIINLLDIGGVYNVASIVWHHFVYVIDQELDVVRFYFDNVLRGTVQISSLSEGKQNLLRGECVLAKVFEPFNWGTTPNNPASEFSDVRIYATALSAEDIKNLYNSPISVSKQHQTMAFEFVEGNDGFSAKKNGIVQHNELRENNSDVNGCYNDKLITNELIEN